MWDKLLPWIGGVFAIIGLILIFFDVIASIKRRDKTKTNVVGLVFLSVAVVGYTITDLILKDSAWPPLASLIWIAMFWVYVIMDACLTMGTIKRVRREKREAKQKDQEQDATDHGEGEAIWKKKFANKKVHVEVAATKLQQQEEKSDTDEPKTK